MSNQSNGSSYAVAQRPVNLTHPLLQAVTVSAPPMAPDAAKKIIENRPMPNIWQPPAVHGLAANTTQGAPSIVELTRALKNDPQLIYEFVYNNIEHALGYGLAKGAFGTLLDGCGTSFDLCSLLAALLRQAGYTVYYEVGKIQLTLAQAADWLGCDTGFFTGYFLLASANVPVQLVGSFPNQQLQLSHCWLKVNVGTVSAPNWVVMDPSFKTYTSKPRIDLSTAMGYSQSTFLTQARSGYTIDGSGNWVQNINRANTRSQLATLATNLANWIKTNNIGATTEDIIGGRQIVPVTLPVSFSASLPYQVAGDTPTEFTSDFSTAYKISFRIEYAIGGIDVTLTSDQLSGKRLTFFFTPSGANFIPVVALDGVTVATGTAQSANISYSVTLTATHNAFATPLVQGAAPIIQGPNANFATGQDYYGIVSSFGPTGRGLFDYHNALQLQYEFDAGGASPTLVAEPPLGERLFATWANYAMQVSRVTQILDRLTDRYSFNFHTFGLANYSVYGTPTFSGFNLAAGAGGGADLLGTANPLAASVGCVGGMHGYAIEMLSVQQLSAGSNAISTTRVLDLANTAGTKIYKGTPSTWTGTVRPALGGYTSSDLNNVDFNVSNGSNVLIPQTAGQTFESHWTLTGYTLFKNNSASGIIFGAYAGVVITGPTLGKPTKGKKGKKDLDPIDVRTGDFTYSHIDLSVGSGEHPYSLSFATSYDSRARLNKGSLGLGWTHNWAVTASKSSDGLLGLATESPLHAVASIAELYVALDLLSDTTLPVDKLVIVSIGNQWWVDQLTNNVVSIEIPNDRSIDFVLLPDGSFNPRDDENSSLSLVSGVYKHTTAQQVVRNFNSAGQLTNIVYPYGVTIALNYTAGKLTSITNGLGRTLTLSYTGNNISGITDGTGQSVGYTIDAANQLTKFTDANAKFTTFAYDTLGRMTQFFLPANPATAIVTNTYDSLNRVKTQKDALNNVSAVYAAGSRTEIVDPVGNRDITYFDSQANVTRETLYAYDE